MLLGISTTDFLLRSTVPAGGLVILISKFDWFPLDLKYHLTATVIVTAASGSLVAPERRDQARRIPEAPSPRMITTVRSISTSGSNDYPPTRYEDLKTEQISSSTAFIQPREVPMPNQPQRISQGPGQGLPNITNAVNGGQGYGGVPVQGQLFPPLRASTEPAKPSPPRLPQNNGKKSFFDSFDPAKAPARTVTIGKLAISNPVLQEGGSNPLDKVATMDLETAAQMDREKRAMMATLQNQAVPVQQVNAAVSPERGLEQATTTVRKEVSAPVPMADSNQSSSKSSSTGFATGAQLSPAGEELRRRSPRRATTENADQKSTGSPARSFDSSRTPSPPPKSAARGLPEQDQRGPVANTIIRPSRQLPPSPEPAPLKTPLQRRPTTGLPGNPRALSVKKKSPPEGLRDREETVMFVNNIVYDDPKFVAGVMEEAKERGPKQPPAPIMTTTVVAGTAESPLIPEAPRTAASIVHRPRPIPRKHVEEGEGSFYPPAGHQRSKSAGHMNMRRTILQSSPGSPTTLPPLPPPPQPQLPSTNNIRPLPNDTKSMTFDEKVSYLFPASQGAERPKRRSSVPNAAGSFMDDSPTLTEFDGQDNPYRDSNKTTESVRTRSIFSDQERSQQREVSLATYRGLIEESDERGRGDSPTAGTMNANGMRRASSPVLPVFGGIKSASTDSFDDEVATNMDSVYSPLPIQQIGVAAVQQARAIDVVRLEKPLDNRAVSSVTNSEEMTIMLDTSIAREVQQSQIDDGPGSPIDDGSPVESRTSTRSSGPWHRRVGDDTLSFSTLSDKRGSRRGPPPTPLALSSRPTAAKQAAIAQAAEPSPLPSPEEALQMIQNQLKKYEEADRGSTQSPGRLALLNDLEMEMGQQETRWLGMQHEFSRDSISTLDMNSPMAASRHASAVPDVSVGDSLSRNSSLRSNVSEDRQVSRRTRLASLIPTNFMAIDGNEAPFGSRASLWQRRLAEAHTEFMEHELDRKPSINFLTMSNLGSPTPPRSDESEVEIESRRNLEALLEAQKKHAASQPMKGLWTAPQAPEDRSGLMWVRPEKPYHVAMAEPPLPGLSVRPAQRKEMSQLSIDMGQLLWEKPASHSTHSSGLWRSSSVVDEPEEETPISESSVPKFYNPGLQRSRTVPSRPLTQRPPRRSKRITALPDILEDPQPLPNKRDTLGIFQFPWGEKSDIPSVPTAPSFMAMPGTMSTRGSNVRTALDARSRELEETEYSSSFFDDYDDDEDNSDDSSEMGSDSSEDGFDETTLFEIANLLQASRTDVPSTNSIFGPSRDRDSVDSFVNGYGSEQEHSGERDSQTVLWDHEDEEEEEEEEEAESVQEMPSPMLRRPESLWQNQEKEERGAHGQGLPQPDDWHTHDEMTETIRAKPRISEQPAQVVSDNLWVLPALSMATSNSPMWTPPESPKPSSSDIALPEMTSSFDETEPASPASSEEPMHSPASPKSPASHDSLLLWQQTEIPQKGDHGVGLPHPEDWANYEGTKETIRTKPRQSEPAFVESINLWAVSPPEVPSLPSNMWAPKAKSLAAVTRISSPVKEAFEVAEPSSVIEEAEPSSVVDQAMPSRVDQVIPSRQLLWSAPSSSTEMDSGLFDLGSGRTDFRNTSQVPAALQMERKARPLVRKPLDHLTSTALWAHATATKTETNWLFSKTIAKPISKAVPEPVAMPVAEPVAMPVSKPVVKTVSKNLLWSAPSSSGDDSAVGLFTPHSGRTDFRHTSLAPAAIEINRKSRSPQNQPLEPLTSKTLWVASATRALPRNWIAPSSARTLEAEETVPSPGVSKATVRQAIAASLQRTEAVPANVWEYALTQALTASYSGGSPEVSVSSEDRDIVLQSAISYQLLRVRAVPAQLWQHALQHAIATSYPDALIAPRETQLQPTFEDQVASKDETEYDDETDFEDGSDFEYDAASDDLTDSEDLTSSDDTGSEDQLLDLAEAAVLSHEEPFDVTKRHPVFATSCLTTTASVVHPAATGYTADVAVMHPVYFGSGVGVAAHPAIPSRANKLIRAFNAAARASAVPNVRASNAFNAGASTAPEEAAFPTLTRQVSQRGRVSRISAMLSRFEEPSRIPGPVASRGKSVEREPKKIVLSRAETPEVPSQNAVAPEQVVSKQVSREEPAEEEESYVDPGIVAQIEALENERKFAERWASGIFDTVEGVATPDEDSLEPSPVFLPATHYVPSMPAQQQPSSAVQSELMRSDSVRSAVSALSETDSERVATRDSLVSIDSEVGRSMNGSQSRFRQ